MHKEAEFGVVIGCCARDYHFAKATIASVRYFLPNLPLCLIIDGAFSTRRLQRTYGIDVLYRSQVQDEFLRRKSFGWGLTKMVAFWEAPYERFLWLDSDTVVWGNLLPHLKLGESWDVLVDQPWDMELQQPRRSPAPDADITRWYFDTAKVETLFPDFPWRDYASRYFCTGFFGMRRGLFPLEEYREMLALAQGDTKLFFPGEMGFLNLMIFRALHEGRITVAETPVQAIVCDYTPEQLERRCAISRSPAEVRGGPGAVLHYTGGFKPTLRPTRPHVVPGLEFRRRALAAMHPRLRPLTDWVLRCEDLYGRWPGWRAVRRRVRRLLRLNGSTAVVAS